MKKWYLILLLTVFFLPIGVYCQVEFLYDDSGNRTDRIIDLKSATISTDSITPGQVITPLEKTESELDNPQFKETFSEVTMKVFPNPTKGEVYLEFNQLPADEDIELGIWGPTGRLIQQRQITNLHTRINLSGRSSGIYILRIKVAGDTKIWKIVKE